MTEIVGGVLVAGLVVFTVGAARWRLDYERPPAESLPLIHADRRRRAWIHIWMLVAMFITPAGVVGFSFLPEKQTAAVVAVMAAIVYAFGALCMIVLLAFRLAVVPWAAERFVADGDVPAGYDAVQAWAGPLYVVHMLASYVAFGLLGAVIVAAGPVASWAGWLGIGLGVVCTAGFLATRFAGPFNPPFLAHLYTGLLGVVLLVS